MKKIPSTGEEFFDIIEEKIGDYGIRLSCRKTGGNRKTSFAIANREVGRAYLYVLKNDLHQEPFGLIEDVFVNEDYRGKGIMKDLVRRALKIAANHNCYKVIATSRHERQKVHEYYKKLGFAEYGIEFRMNLK